MSADSSDADGGLIDITGLSLRDLDVSGESGLEHALRRILWGHLDESEAIAGFSSDVGP